MDKGPCPDVGGTLWDLRTIDSALPTKVRGDNNPPKIRPNHNPPLALKDVDSKKLKDVALRALYFGLW